MHNTCTSYSPPLPHGPSDICGYMILIQVPGIFRKFSLFFAEPCGPFSSVTYIPFVRDHWTKGSLKRWPLETRGIGRSTEVAVAEIVFIVTPRRWQSHLLLIPALTNTHRTVTNILSYQATRPPKLAGIPGLNIKGDPRPDDIRGKETTIGLDKTCFCKVC